MRDENWKKIDGTRYSVSDLGRVRNDNSGRILRQSKVGNKGNQYYGVELCPIGTQRVHRLVAKAFVPNPDNKPCVDHKDGNRQNNKIANLRWATYSENNSRFNTLGVRSEKIRVTHYRELRNKRGGGHIKWLDVDNIQYFDRIIDAANHFAVTQGNITPLLKSGKIGVRGKMRGYKFEYCKSSMNV